MGLPAKKNDALSDAEAVDMSTDREQGLAKNFEDPLLEDLVPGYTEAANASPLSLLQETAEAVHELISLPEGESAPDEKEIPVFLVDGIDSNLEPDSSRWKLSEKLFQLVACDLSFDALVETALESVMDALGAQAGSVLELDYEREDFFFRASIGGSNPAEKIKSFRVPVSNGIVGHVAESRQALLLRDLEKDEMQLRAISMGVGFDAKTCMAAPILLGTQLYGVIEIFNHKSGILFEEKDLCILEDGARMISKILEVRFLMAELARRAG